ncbi:four-carbon acid sugar kinase family protein [Effusibacillus dendaii]|uniref:Hrp-dependent type III effector protein n=1 Tax=Effusibacillus dendaii TaxID=2743772 RepID=A0A7I8DBD0_9BACL|nr:four-carbon acid sugar kinase family protein [Effusibacillus dendaii]BCJ86269.1 Hrp-dependent type III effector protein [Effusibacillus dendaii]
MTQLVIIADDLTGSNDAGLQFAKQGFRTITLFDADFCTMMDEADVRVFNVETRSLGVREAYSKTEQFCKKIDLNRVRYVYKKIDSTMRGNIGAEIDALMDNVPFDLAVVAPAYPRNKRLTVGGYHLVNHLLLEDSEISRDPKCPVTESHIPTLLGTQTNRSVGHVDLRQIRKSVSELQDYIKNQVAANIQVLVFDSCSEADLKAVADAVSKLPLKVLWVGSAGLAHAMSGTIPQTRHGRISRPQTVTDDHFPAFVVAGSVNDVTRRQIEALSEQADFQLVPVDPLQLLEGSADNREKLINDVIAVIDSGKSPVLTTQVGEKTRKSVEHWIRQNGTDGLQAGNQIADSLGEIAARISAARKLQGLALTGGDIAFRTCKHLNVQALLILDEVEEGIPLSLIVGGDADSLPVVTKAGAFGTPDSLIHAVNKINSFRRERRIQ